jgi:BirA family biotin operon repressor/biotin-[acetyl-CoA-carboxylase] ligase
MTSTLDAPRLVAALGQASRRFDVDLLPQCDSTNSMLLNRAEVGAASGTVVAATLQTAGRGRRGREWIAAPGDSLTFSLLWRFAPGSVPIGLSLAVGVAVARALEKVMRSGIQPDGAGDTPQRFESDRRGYSAVSGKHPWGVALKWPNDVLYQGKKLGGILVELLPGAPHVAVIGIGINRRLPAALPHDVRATATALDDPIEINVLLAALLSELLTVLESFAIAGFAALRADWLARHAFQDAPVVLLSDFSPSRHGICRGVDKDGALLLEVDGHIERILSGEISLRAAAPV